MRSSLFGFSLLLAVTILFTSCGDKPDEGSALKYGAMIDLADSVGHFNPAMAESLYLKVLRDSTRIDQKQLTEALTGQSKLYCDRSKYDSASALITKAFQLASSNSDSNLMMLVLMARGDLYTDLGDNIKAGKYYHEGLAIAKLRHNESYISNFSLALGSVVRENGNYSEAVKIYTEALKYSEQSGNVINQALALENIGLTLNLTDDSKDALGYITQALEIRKKNNLQREYAMGLQNLGICLRRLNRPDSALECYRQARVILLQLNDSNTLVKVIYNSGLVLKNQKKYREARQAMGEVLKICRNKGIADGEVYALHTLASICDQEGELGKGILYSDSAIALAKRYNLISPLPRLMERKQEMLTKAGEYKEACFLLQRYKELDDSILSLDKQKEIAMLKTRFDTERKEAENDLLKKDLQYQRSRQVFQRGIMILSLLVFVLVTLIFLFRYRNLKQLKLLADEKALRQEQKQRNQALQLEMARLETDLKETRIGELEYQSKLREQELVFQSLIRTDLTNVNRSVHEKLLQFSHKFHRKKDQEEFLQSLSEITRDASREPLSEFEQTFARLHPSFFEKLLEKYPNVTKTEIQICAMIRLNLSSKDIARLLNLSVSTIETTRYHIRKKLELDNAENLLAFLITI